MRAEHSRLESLAKLFDCTSLLDATAAAIRTTGDELAAIAAVWRQAEVAQARIATWNEQVGYALDELVGCHACESSACRQQAQIELQRPQQAALEEQHIASLQSAGRACPAPLPRPSTAQLFTAVDVPALEEGAKALVKEVKALPKEARDHGEGCAPAFGGSSNLHLHRVQGHVQAVQEGHLLAYPLDAYPLLIPNVHASHLRLL